MITLMDVMRTGERVAPRHVHLDEAQWEQLVQAAGGGGGDGRVPVIWLIAHWCDAGRAYALFLDGEAPMLVSTALAEGRYLALSATLPAAAWGERAAQDLVDARPMFARDVASLLDLSGWTTSAPMGRRPAPGVPAVAPDARHEPLDPAFAGAGAALLMPQQSDGDGGALSFTPGLAHRGVMHRLLGKRPEEALSLLGRISAGAYVAHPLAYCRAVEDALGAHVPPAGRDGRIILSEIERIAVHLHDIARTARIVDAGLLDAHAALAREALAALCVEHGATARLTDCIAPEGIASRVAPAPLAVAVVDLMRKRFPMIATLQESFADRLRGRAVIGRSAVERCCIGGLVGRAAGRAFDLRQSEEDYRYRAGRAGSLTEGDALARATLRLREIRDSMRRLKHVTDGFAAELGASSARTVAGEGIGAAEGARGDIWYWVRLRDGVIEAIWARDPAFSLGPALGAVARREGEDGWPLVMASLGVSTAAMAL